MALRKIITYPEPSLSRPSAPVAIIDDEIRTLIRDMEETMHHESGIGLAAPQVGVNQRVIVYDARTCDPDDDGSDSPATALINPRIIEASGSFISENEGCLSVTDYRADVKRYDRVRVQALTPDGTSVEFDAEGMEAVVLQHEIDHLDGILFIDRISTLKRSIYKKRVMKKLREDAQA
jgi:peptide deformylase